jgi:hypothetical protein
VPFRIKRGIEGDFNDVNKILPNPPLYPEGHEVKEGTKNSLFPIKLLNIGYNVLIFNCGSNISKKRLTQPANGFFPVAKTLPVR